MQSTQWNALKRLINYSSHKKREIRLAVLYSILNKTFDLAPPLLIGLAVETVISTQKTFLYRHGLQLLITQLSFIAGLTFIIWALESLFEYLFQVYWRNLAQEIQHQIRKDCYQHLQNLELAYFENKSTGNLMNILNDDVNQLERFLDGGANSLIQVSTTVIIIGLIFFILSPLVALLSFLPIPFILIGSFYYQRKIEPRYAQVREQAGHLGSLLTNNLSAMATIKSYNAEKFELTRLDQQSRKYSLANEVAIKLSSSFSPLIRMIVLIGFLCAMIVGGYQTQTGEIAVGSYSVLIFMTQRLLWPLTGLGQTFDLFQRAMASVNRLLNLLDTPISILSGTRLISREKVRGHIQFKNVSFAYSNNNLILKKLKIEIRPGETIGLVGPTGSGKSSIVKLLLRFYDIQQGHLLIDGVDIKEWSFHSLRDAFSYVGQDGYLFHGTIRENIVYGSFNKNDQEIIDAAKKAEAYDFIQSCPQGLDTIIGERGQKLSGGQKQRISIARAILKNSPLFIFDEATSAVDNETEAAIQRSINLITQTKTTILIAHRLSTLVNADKIYVLDKGEIIEEGTHKELIAHAGLYQRLWKVQTGTSNQTTT